VLLLEMVYMSLTTCGLMLSRAHCVWRAPATAKRIVSLTDERRGTNRRHTGGLLLLLLLLVVVRQ